jgi:serine/threonine-protein kinase
MSLVKLPNEVQLGRYRLTARLGHGGMAEVFLGRLLGVAGFEKLVAIKRMLPNLSSDPNVVAMFENEGRIASQLDHPNVCQVYELGEADGQMFLAMEYLRGLPLHDIIPAIPDRPLATQLRFVVGVIVQACEGLHYAHTSVDVDGQPRPIVHRDVSPTNLFVTTEGIVKVLDFGVSKMLTEVTMTRAGTLKGKLPYMPPEQIRGEQLDARSDVFAIAAVTWEAITGHQLFPRASIDDVWRTAQEEVPRLPGDGPVITQVDQVVRRALDPDRERRPASARAFATELKRAIEPCGDPMSATEIQSHVALWLESNLARRSRDLAALLGRVRSDTPPREDEDPETVPIEPQRTLDGGGVRLREVSLVVQESRGDAHGPTTEELDAAPTLENLPQTVVEPPRFEPETAPLAPIMRTPAPTPKPQLQPGVAPIPSSGQATILLPPPTEPPPRRDWVPHIVFALVAIVIGFVTAIWLS